MLNAQLQPNRLFMKFKEKTSEFVHAPLISDAYDRARHYCA